MKNEVRPLRVLLKAIFLFVALNVVFAFVDPAVGKITLFNSVFPGRLRFPYEKEPSFYSVGHNAPVYEDFDAMFGAHIISSSKPANEFRLILLGDSATWGVSVAADETLSEQINRLHIQTCDGRVVRAYNLGYPMSFPTRDILILDQAMEYKPDMALWLITLSTLQPKTAETYFIALHAEQYLQLANTYNLKSPHFSGPIQKPSFWQKTIIGQRRRLKNIILTQAFGALWAATGIDNHEGLQPETTRPSSDVEDDLRYEGRLPGDSQHMFDSLMMDTLSVGAGVARDIPVILVNEPIFVAGGKNHLVRYNSFYPRWVYDDYRQFMGTWTQANGRKFLDYWNALPPEGFADQNFHRNAAGEKRFAELLAPAIRNLVCP
ncbi:MAG TPA: hypothetical protein VLE49_10945 [Anaerolineales bacterium]|nr:hypothetical protein [Anaerolineales bacterium]